jgi:lipoprotein YgeR
MSIFHSGRGRERHFARAVAAIVCAFACARDPLAAQGTYHVLQKGETLFAVAKKYDVSLEALLISNSIEDPNKLRIGQKIIIPDVYKVAKGDTLFGIARERELSVEVLRAANKLSEGSVIKPGDTLIIPAREAAPAVTAPASAATPAIPASGAAAMPTPLRVSSKPVDSKVSWPCAGEMAYLDGKLEGIMIKTKYGESAKAVASGTVVSAGFFRGYSQVAIVQSGTGQLYVYGGNENLAVSMGDKVKPGQEIGRIGSDPKLGGDIAYFFVYKKNGEATDPATASRD